MIGLLPNRRLLGMRALLKYYNFELYQGRKRPSAKVRVRRVVMEWGADYGSLRLKPPEPHHLAPLLGFLGDELAELGGRAGKRLAAYFGKLCPHRRIAEAA